MITERILAKRIADGTLPSPQERHGALAKEMVAVMHSDPERYRELNIEFNIRCRQRRRRG